MDALPFTLHLFAYHKEESCEAERTPKDRDESADQKAVKLLERLKDALLSMVSVFVMVWTPGRRRNL